MLLLHHNAGAISVVDSSGNTALHWAALNGHDSVSCLLGRIHKFIEKVHYKKFKSSRVKLPLIKTSDNRMSFTNMLNEYKIVKNQYTTK